MVVIVAAIKVTVIVLLVLVMENAMVIATAIAALAKIAGSNARYRQRTIENNSEKYPFFTREVGTNS